MRKQTLAPGEFYHIYSRGVDRRDIFMDEDDRDRFMSLLYLANNNQSFKIRELGRKGNTVFALSKQGELCAIGAYVLMTNHFHLLIKETQEGGITKFLHSLLTSYSKYFNKKYERTGRLFESTFRAEWVNMDEYLKYLFSYIHLNPIKTLYPKWKEEGILDIQKAQTFLSGYRYSSYPDYVGEKREQSVILHTSEFPEYFSQWNINEYKKEMGEWLEYSKGKIF
ncbi:MAG: transposase [Candidatus Paceibacterota bacterium]